MNTISTQAVGFDRIMRWSLYPALSRNPVESINFILLSLHVDIAGHYQMCKVPLASTSGQARLLESWNVFVPDFVSNNNEDDYKKWPTTTQGAIKCFLCLPNHLAYISETIPTWAANNDHPWAAASTWLHDNVYAHSQIAFVHFGWYRTMAFQFLFHHLKAFNSLRSVQPSALSCSPNLDGYWYVQGRKLAGPAPYAVFLWKWKTRYENDDLANDVTMCCVTRYQAPSTVCLHIGSTRWRTAVHLFISYVVLSLRRLGWRGHHWFLIEWAIEQRI